jgi:hypothetical protein
MYKSEERLLSEALERIFGRVVRAIITEGKITVWDEPNEIQPSKEEINNVMNEIRKEEPLNLLRMERNKRLSECDWRMGSDYPNDDQDEWAQYRTELRDLIGKVESGLMPMPIIKNSVLIDYNHWPQKPNS